MFSLVPMRVVREAEMPSYNVIIILATIKGVWWDAWPAPKGS
jgi:hypothetical protein